MDRLKCVTVGDGNVGKTSLLMRFWSGIFDPDVLKQLDYFDVDLKVDGTDVKLLLYDTSGVDGMLICSDAHVVIIAFSLVKKCSYESVFKKWIPELTKFAPKTTLILAGTKMELRDGQLLSPEAISTEQGEELRRLIGAAAYVECSAKTHLNVSELFDLAVKLQGQAPYFGLGLCQSNTQCLDVEGEEERMFYLMRVVDDDRYKWVIELPQSLAEVIKLNEDGRATLKLRLSRGFKEERKNEIVSAVAVQVFQDGGFVIHMTDWRTIVLGKEVLGQPTAWLKFLVQDGDNEFNLEWI